MAARLTPVPVTLGKSIVVRRVPPVADADGVNETFASLAGKSVFSVQQGRISTAVISEEPAVRPSRLTVTEEASFDATIK